MKTPTHHRGRKKGSLNRRTVELTERLEQLGCDPVAGLVSIAADQTATLELRARCYESLLPYLYPKRKAIDVTVAGEISHEEALEALEAFDAIDVTGN